MSDNRYELNKNLAQMLKGGVIMDVTTPEQAKIAEAAVSIPVMAKCRIGLSFHPELTEDNRIHQNFTYMLLLRVCSADRNECTD